MERIAETPYIQALAIMVLSVLAADELNTEVYKRFQREGIEIPYPQRDIHLKST